MGRAPETHEHAADTDREADAALELLVIGPPGGRICSHGSWRFRSWTDPASDTVLMWTAGHSSEAGVLDIVDVTKLLLERGANIDDRDNRGRTALMIAAELNHAAVVDLLLERGADKTLRDAQGKSAADLTTLTALREKLAAAH